MPQKTIAYLTPLYLDPDCYLGGGERYPLNLARGVVAASQGRYRVELISFGRESHVRSLSEGVDLRVLVAAGKPSSVLDVVSWELPQALSNADLVHIHQAYTRCSEVGILVARQLRKPICITDHGGDSSSLGKELNILDLTDRVVAYSDFGASFYQTRTPIQIIKGGVDATIFTPPLDPPVRDRVLFVGRLLPHKGIDQLIQALPEELPLTICGPPYHPEYLAHLKSLSGGKQVEFVTDATDHDIRDLYHRSWATVLSSVYRDCYGTIYQRPELMGFTLLESMACGTPAIASRVGGMPEFIDEGVTGFVYDTPDVLTSRLRELARNPRRCDEMGKRARRRVLDWYDHHVAGRSLFETYAELMAMAKDRGAAA